MPQSSILNLLKLVLITAPMSLLLALPASAEALSCRKVMLNEAPATQTHFAWHELLLPLTEVIEPRLRQPL